MVATAGALEGLRPAMVEDVLALAVALHIERHGAEQGTIGGFGQQVLRLPAGAPADRLGILQRLQEAVAEERVAGRAGRQRTGVPPGGVDARQGIDDAQSDGRGVVRHDVSIARIVPGKGHKAMNKKSPADRSRRTPKEFRLSTSAEAKALHWLECANFEGGFRWGPE